MTLADIVESCIAEHAFAREVYPSEMTFDVLVSSVRFLVPDADVCAIDKAARPFERGEPGAYTYEPIEERAMTLLHGIDVSSYQGQIDWESVRNAGYSFAWIKATEGSTHVDKRFAENWKRAGEAGLQRGAYHFMTATTSPLAQASAFLRVYPGGGELPIALDLERSPNGTSPRAHAAMEWLDIVERRIGAKPIVYTNPSFADERGFGHFCLGQYDLWIAHYGVAMPRIPRPWAEWRVWQTGTGHVAGIKGQVDLNVMRAW